MSEVQVHQWRIDEWFPEVPSPARQNMKKYHEELLRFNRTINLISPKTAPHADVIHFADSILACRLIQDKAGSKIDQICDFGSGNGFPGLIMAILYPATKVVMVDSDQRKCEFLKQMVSTLRLSNATAECAQIENLADSSVRFAMARGFASISKAILVARRSMAVGGSFFHLKGEAWSAEVGEIPTQLCSVWSPGLLGEYKLPLGTMRFAVVRTDKIA